MNKIQIPFYFSQACIGYLFFQIGYTFRKLFFTKYKNSVVIIITICSLIGYSAGIIKHIHTSGNIIDRFKLLVFFHPCSLWFYPYHTHEQVYTKIIYSQLFKLFRNKFSYDNVYTFSSTEVNRSLSTRVTKKNMSHCTY